MVRPGAVEDDEPNKPVLSDPEPNIPLDVELEACAPKSPPVGFEENNPPDGWELNKPPEGWA